MKSNRKSAESEFLRQRADELLRAKAIETDQHFNDSDLFKLIQQLLAHQLELEKQNDELRHLWAKSEVANDRYTGLYDFTPTGYLMLNRAGKIIELNVSGANILGNNRLQLKNTQFGLFVSAASLTDFNRFLAEVFEGKLNESCDLTLAAGGSHPVNIHLTGIMSANGEQCLITMVDISERKRTEEALREREEKLRDITYSMTDWVWEVDAHGTFIYSSQKSIDLLGEFREEVIGKTPFDFMPPDEAKRVSAIFSEIAEKKAPIKDLENWNVRKNGERICLLTNGVPVLDQDGNLKGYRGVDRDITAQKMHEEALMESEERYRILSYQSPIAIEFYNHDGRLVSVNPACLDLFGIVDLNEIKQFSLFSHPNITDENKLELQNGQNIRYQAHFDFDKVKELHVYQTTKSGRIWLDVQITITKNRKNELNGYLVQIQDITERKMADDLLRQTRLNYESFFNTTDEFLFVLDEQGNIIHVNETVTDRLGYTHEELTGLSVLMIHPPNRRDEAGSILRDMLSGKTGFCPVPILSKTGMQIPVETRVSRGIWDGKPAIFGVTKDISKIQLSEEKFSKLFHINPSACGLSDLVTGRYVEVNEAFYTMFGFNREEVIGKTAKELGILSDEIKNTIMQSADVNGNVKSAGADLTTKDGTLKHVLLSSENIYIQDEKYRFTVVQDITGRTMAEQALAESEARLKLALGLAKIANWEYTVSTGKIWGSDDAFELFGLEVTENHEMWISDFEAHIVDFEKSKKALFDLIEKDIPFIEESATIPVNGAKSRIFHTVGKLTRDHHGAPEKVLGMFQDITELRHAGNLLRKSEQKFRSITEQTQDLIALTDTVGTITYASSASRALFFMEPEEMCGRPFMEFLSEASIPKAFETFSMTLRSGKGVKNLELLMKRKDGSFFTGELNGSHFNSGDETGTFVVIHDITERKQAEEELIKSKEHAEESDRLKSAFLTNMSHEIRTPMNGILGFAGLLKEPDLSGDEQQKYIRIIEKSGARMLNIINDIIDISKIEAGLVELNISKSDVNEQIEYIYTFFKPEVEAKGMKLSYTNALASKKAEIETDREKLYAILTNLVKNAIKYTRAGSIEFGYTVKSHLSPPAGEPVHQAGEPVEPGELEFFVRDTGIGIPKDRHDAIFERFIQADLADKHAYQGAGLGLSISKAYVEMMGGKIRVDSEVGKGSVFYFTLPVRKDAMAGSRIVIENNAGSHNLQISNLKILVVEDDEISEIYITTLVEKLSAVMLHAISGIEAIETCREHPDLDMILMDINIPELNGYDATRQIRKFNQEVVIVAQTAYGLEGDREKALAAGCNDYISKPINKDMLFAIMQRHLKR